MSVAQTSGIVEKRRFGIVVEVTTRKLGMPFYIRARFFHDLYRSYPLTIILEMFRKEFIL